jgi:DnaJ-class molecular chaperone
MELVNHPMYRLDDVLDSWDLFAEVYVTWVDFLCGRKITLPYIDGTSVDIDIQPFKDYTEMPIIFADKGLCGLGNMYVAIKMQPPSCDASVWNALPARERSSVVDTFRTLYEPTTRV